MLTHVLLLKDATEVLRVLHKIQGLLVGGGGALPACHEAEGDGKVVLGA